MPKAPDHREHRLLLELLRQAMNESGPSTAVALRTLEGELERLSHGDDADVVYLRHVLLEILSLDLAATGLLADADVKRFEELLSRARRLGKDQNAELETAERLYGAERELARGRPRHALAALGNVTTAMMSQKPLYPTLDPAWTKARCLARLGSTAQAGDVIKDRPRPEPHPVLGARQSLADELLAAEIQWFLAMPRSTAGEPDWLSCFSALRSDPRDSTGLRAWQKSIEHPSHPYASDIMLLKIASSSLQFETSGAKKVLATSRDDVTAKCIRLLTSALDQDESLERRTLAATEAAELSRGARTLEREILIVAAAARVFLKLNQTTSAAHAIGEYRELCLRATARRSDDPYAFFGNVDQEKLVHRYAPPLPSKDQAAEEEKEGIPYGELAALFLKVGGFMARGTLLRTITPGANKSQVTIKGRADIARAVARYLQRRRGAIVKVGQVTSYFGGPLAEFVRSEFEVFGTRIAPMSEAAVSQIIERELGRAPEQLYQTWDARPIASGSLGQVHRATTKDGRDVAVKVQYLHIDELIEEQVRAARMAARVLRPFWPGQMNVDQALDELGRAIADETDYRAEAANLAFFRQAFAGDESIVIPAPLTELCSARVLTIDYVPGLSFAAFKRAADDQRRASAADTIVRMTFRSVYALGMFNTDPQPGNFLFQPNAVAFIDFGGVRRFSPAYVRGRNKILAALLAGTKTGVVEAALEAGFIEREDDVAPEEILDVFAKAQFLSMLEGPQLVPTNFPDHIFRAFTTENKSSKRFKLPEDALFVSRLYLGTMSLVRDLEAPVDFRRHLLAALEESWGLAAKSI